MPDTSPPQRFATSRELLADVLLRASIGLGIVVAVVVCFRPLLDKQFLIWDETDLLVDNARYAGLSGAHLAWMFSTFLYGHYQPLTWLSFAMDHLRGAGLPAAFQQTNLLLHALNAVLFYALIRSLLREAYGPAAPRGLARLAAGLGALFFAIHPLRVESVAWLAARNDLLSGLFGLLTVLTYLRGRRSGAERQGGWLLLSLVCFVLGLACKAVLMTLPLILLVLDVYVLRRVKGPTAEGWRPVLRDKIPYTLPALGCALLALVAKREAGGLGDLASHGVLARLGQAAYGLCFYLWKTVVPRHLSPLYLLADEIDPTQPRYLVSFGLVAAGVVGVLLLRRRAPWLFAAAAAYAIVLFPMLGATQSGAQLVADRYTYLACMPWAVLLACAVAWPGLERTAGRLRARALVALSISLWLAALGFAAHRLTLPWHDSIRFWTHVLEIEPQNYFAHQNRGRAHHLRGELDQAIEDYTQVIHSHPEQGRAWRSRGIVLRQAGDLERALADLTRYLELEPQAAQGYLDRGQVQRLAGRLPQAIADFSAAIERAPGLARAWAARGTARRLAGDAAGARADFDTALQLDGADPLALLGRGETLLELQHPDLAAVDLQRALDLAPTAWPRRAETQALLDQARPADPGRSR